MTSSVSRVIKAALAGAVALASVASNDADALNLKMNAVNVRQRVAAMNYAAAVQRQSGAITRPASEAVMARAPRSIALIQQEINTARRMAALANQRGREAAMISALNHVDTLERELKEKKEADATAAAARRTRLEAQAKAA